ncbi:hypothetical protein QP940_08570 [Corynebacterium pseudodiphtheriticum]|uniref:hypothetical protein n=1 Tax=Corynebacterium pseudodiphtheriticum TaxID=37637 RepID=UPI002550D0F1|nr:hypothetical protein [Corynebacterium pseudodiphtheriticum]MDK8614811.1 hypothetical protein [Corynebacterium pseudodiphtheriticum]MDK8738750.1 hypothetical protein [Corynebacterium pseudodiphtheriticum]MDK8745292.1 hypothetical protein [Corynebacterium pseudodiphtheriticum]
MPYVLLTLAVIAGAAAIFLWYLDSKQRRAQQAEQPPAAVELPGQPEQTGASAELADAPSADIASANVPGASIPSVDIPDAEDSVAADTEWSAQATYGDVLRRGRVLDDEELATAEQLPQQDLAEQDEEFAAESAGDPIAEANAEVDNAELDSAEPLVEPRSELDAEPHVESDLENDAEAESALESERQPEPTEASETPKTAETSETTETPETIETAPKPEPGLASDELLSAEENRSDASDASDANDLSDAAAVHADGVNGADHFEERDDAAEQPTPVAKPAGPRRDSIIPGALRRERRQWAEKNGFSFSKHDEYLVDEWTRGAAAGGAAPKDIVQGSAYGHEMVLMDLGGVNVMAMRTGAATEIVVDFRRVDRDQRNDRTTGEAVFDDLLEVGHIADFTVYATDAAVASRMIDARVVTACDSLPEIVTAVWMESDWVLAQTDKGSHASDWDEMLAPLGLLADVARVLPPRSMANQILKFEGADPTRMMGPKQPPAFENNQLLHVVPDPQDHPPIQRPSEPVELPTRSKAEARGYLEPYALGVDEVDAIADGVDKSQEGGHRKRPHVKRDLSAGPSIFGDE